MEAGKSIGIPPFPQEKAERMGHEVVEKAKRVKGSDDFVGFIPGMNPRPPVGRSMHWAA
jgi:hypothetical protein